MENPENDVPRSDVYWTLFFIVACIMPVYKLMKMFSGIATESIFFGIATGIAGAICGIVLKRISYGWPFYQRILLLFVLIMIFLILK